MSTIYNYTRPVDLGRRHLTHLRRRLRDHGIRPYEATRPPHDPTAAMHVVQLAVVYPEECRIDCRDTDVHQRALGAVKGHTGPLWHQRARAAGRDSQAEPVLLWEDVAWDLVLQPTAQAQLQAVRLTERWTPLGTAILHAGDDAILDVVLVGGAATHVRLTADDVRVPAEAPEPPANPKPGWVPEPGPWWDEGYPVADGRVRCTATSGHHVVRVEARGSGTLEAAAVQVGTLALVERHRRYHPVG